jgi:NRPS condensation-like uncharacterized protein
MLDRHPLLRARVESSWRGLRWVVETADRVPVLWVSTPVDETWVSDSRLDLFQHVGMRVFVHHSSEACTIVLQCHHACVDGLGLQVAIDELWTCYNARVKGLELPLSACEPDLLPLRNRFDMTLLKALSVIPKQAIGLLGVRQYLMRDPVPLIPHKRIPETSGPPLPAICLVTLFDAETVNQLRRVASEHRVTLNELMLCSIFEAIAIFRRNRGHDHRDEWVRMMVPVNMRTTGRDRRQTACNIVSSIFLDRTSGQMIDRKGLLLGIHQEMELIKRNRLGFIFIASLWIKKNLPAKFGGQSAPRRCQTTVVVTNVGKSFLGSPLGSHDGIYRTGNLTLEEVIMLAPMTPFLPAAFTISEYAGEMQLALRYDNRVLSKDDARDLLQKVESCAREWVATFRNCHESDDIR